MNDITNKQGKSKLPQKYKYGSIGEVIKGFLTKRSISLYDVSNDVTVTPSTLYNIVDGTTNPKMDTLIELANFFNITIDQLVGMAPLYEKTSTAGITLIPMLDDKIYKEQILQEGKNINNLTRTYPVINVDNAICAYRLIQNIGDSFFKAGSIAIIVNSEIINGSYALIDDGGSLTIRRIIKDGSEITQESLLTGKQSPLSPKVPVIGIVKDVNFRNN